MRTAQGKSTLAKCLLGAYKPEEGEVRLDQVVKFNGTKEALAKGIVAVYQEFTLVPYISVAQNIFFNREYKTGLGLIDHKKMEEGEAAKLLKALNCEYINPKDYVKNLSITEQQMVEIAKALSFNPRIMVFDEPTATLSEREVDSPSFAQIHRLKAEESVLSILTGWGSQLLIENQISQGWG